MYNLKRFVVGPLQSNAYILWNEKNEAILFDIGSFEFSEILNFLEKKNLQLKGLFLTHGHIDHIAGVNLLLRVFPTVKVYIGKNEEEYLTNAEYNLSYHIFREIFKVEALDRVVYLKENDEVFGVRVIDTPGHTKGGVCYYIKEDGILISGDTLFAGSMGRTDFLGGNTETLFKSLKKLCDTLPKETIVYSGHGRETTIGRENDNLFGGYYDEY